MAKRWATPIYTFTRWTGKPVVIDVTTSISSGLEAHRIVQSEFIPRLRKLQAQSVLDFGAGALRHVFPLLRARFKVCAVEFEEAFKKPVAAKALKDAEKSNNFRKLIWPRDFVSNNDKFDACLLSFVLQTMPMPKERQHVIKAISDRVRTGGLLLYLSRYNQIDDAVRRSRISDGYFHWPDREIHSFYREFSTRETHEMMEKHNFGFVRNLSGGGKEQVLLYEKRASTGFWA
jgi:SAM-dependent methyltransferase